MLDKKLSFKKHIDEKINKTKKIIGTIKYLNKYLPLKTLILMYKSLVRPHFDYCDVIFHIPPDDNGIFDNINVPVNESLNSLMAKIESIQYKSALAITGTWKGTSRLKLYNELGFESLSGRRSLNRVIQLFKIKSNLSPAYLRQKLPTLSIQNDINANPDCFNEITARTIRFKKSFYSNAVSSWNNVIMNINGYISKTSIKTNILKIKRPNSKSIYDIHDPTGLHYLFQLRTGLSPLRSHKHHHNFVDTPTENCICNRGVENTYHYLFECFYFAIHRVELTVNINNILQNYNQALNLANEVDFYLYGHSELSFDDNKKVLSSTIKYLKSTGRFPG